MTGGILASLRKRWTIRRYLKLLPRRLRQDFGHRGPYTPAQVEAAIRRHRIASPEFSPYAVAIFCDRDALRRLRADGATGPDYDGLRREVGRRHFGGDVDFTLSDVMLYTAEHGEPFHDGLSGQAGDHHDGGGGHH